MTAAIDSCRESLRRGGSIIYGQKQTEFAPLRNLQNAREFTQYLDSLKILLPLFSFHNRGTDRLQTLFLRAPTF